MFALNKESKFGVATRLLIIAMLIFFSVMIILDENLSLSKLAMSSIIEFSMITILLAFDNRLSAYLNGLKVIFLFVLIGALFYVFSLFTGIGPKSIINVIIGVIKTALLIMPFSLFVSWLAPIEISFILEKSGLNRVGVMLRAAISQIPILLLETSDSFFTIKLKYGRRKLYRAVYYMILQSFLLGKSFYEAYYVYGLPTSRIYLIKKAKTELIVMMISLMVVSLTIIYILQ